MSKTSILHVNVPPHIKDKLKELSKKDNRTITGWLIQVIEEKYLKGDLPPIAEIKHSCKACGANKTVEVGGIPVVYLCDVCGTVNSVEAYYDRLK